MTGIPSHPELLLAQTDWLRALAAHLVRDPDAADDLVQDTLLAALTGRGPTRGGLRAWLAAVARNLAAGAARSEQRRQHRERRAARSDAVPAAADTVERFSLHRQVCETVLGLDEPYRTAVLLRYWDGRSARAIAAQLAIPVETVRTRLKRGLATLRGRLDDCHGGDRQAWVGALACWALPAGPSTWIMPKLAGMWTMKQSTKITLGAVLLATITLSLSQVDWWRRSAAGTADPVPAPTALDRAAAATAEGADDGAGAAPPERETLRPTAPRPADPVAAVPAQVVLRARCQRPDESPLAGVAMRVAGSEDPGTPAVSDAAGEVSLTLPWTGSEADGATTVRLEFVDAQGSQQDRQCQVSGPGTIHLGAVVLPLVGQVAGRVVDPKGRARAGAEVVVRFAGAPLSAAEREHARIYGARRAMNDPPSRAVTDELGRYRLRGLPNGIYIVQARAADTLYSFSDAVTVREGESRTLPDIALEYPPPHQAIQGTVLDPAGTPLAGIRLYMMRPGASGSLPGGTASGPDGRFTILPPDDGFVVVHAVGGERYETVQKQARRGELALELRFEEPRWIDVEAVTETGEAVPGARFEAQRQHGSRWVKAVTVLRATKAGGQQLRAPNRTYRLRATAPGFNSTTLGPFDQSDPKAGHRIVLRQARGFRGKVTVDGAPASGVAVHAHPLLPVAMPRATDYLPRLLPRIDARVETGPDGTFFLPLRYPAKYGVHFEGPGGRRAELSPVELVADAPTDLGAVALQPPGTLAGQVLVAAEVAKAGIVVCCSRGDGHYHSTRTDEAGRFRFEGLLAGTYQVLRIKEQEAARPEFRFRTHNRAPYDTGYPVAAGRTSHCEIDCRADVPIKVQIEVRFAGKPPVGWDGTVHIRGTSQLQGALDSAGRLAGTLLGRRKYSISLAAPVYARFRVMVSGELDLESHPGGPATWRFEVPTGTLRLTGLPLPDQKVAGLRLPPARYRLHWTDAAGTDWVLPLRFADSGSLTIPAVPAGVVELKGDPTRRGLTSIAEYPTLQKFRVVAGKTTEADVSAAGR